MSKPRHLPDPDRLSVVAATILLAYALTRFVTLPTREVAIQLPGVYLAVQLNIRTLVALFVTGLTSTGSYWLVRDHPVVQSKSTIEHWLLPGLTAWVISFPLYSLPLGTQWITGFVIGGGVLLLVLLAEYISVDPEDGRYPLASATLIVVSFTLFLILTVLLRASGARLFLVLPAITLSAGLIGLRIFHLRLQRRWATWQAILLAFIIAQFSAALHYLPITSIPFGLAVLGPTYALTSLVGDLVSGIPFRQAFFEPTAFICIAWLIAYWTL